MNYRLVTTSNGVPSWTTPQHVPFGAGSPGAAVFNNRLYLEFGQQLKYGYQDLGGTWFGQFSLGGPETNRKPSAAEHEGRLYFLYKGKDTDNIYYKIMDTWGSLSPQYALSPSRTLQTPSAVSFNGQLWFFYRGDSTSNLYYNTID
jgi:hypothetical protein